MAERTINSDDPKYDALRQVLKKQGRDVDDEFIALVRQRCEELVDEDEYKPKFPKGSFGVYGFKDQDEILYFTSSTIMTLYQSAICYRNVETYARDFTLDSMVYECFGEDSTALIREDLFAVLTKAMAKDKRITVAAVYDMDRDTVEVHDRKGGVVRHYTLDTLIDALETAEISYHRKGVDAEDAMKNALAGREYLTEPVPYKGYIEAKFIICESALKVVDMVLDYVDCKYTDPLINCLYDTKKGLETLTDGKIMNDAEAVRPHLQEFLDHYTDMVWADGYLEYHGWDRCALAKAIVCEIENQEIRDMAYSHITEDSVEDHVEDAEETHEMTM